MELGTFSWYHLCHSASGTAWLPWRASPRAGSSPVCSQRYAGDPRQQLGWHEVRLVDHEAGPYLSGVLPSHVPQWAPVAEPSLPQTEQAALAPEYNTHFVCHQSTRAIQPVFCCCCFHLPLPFVLSGRTEKEGEHHSISLCSVNVPSNRAKFFLAGLFSGFHNSRTISGPCCALRSLLIPYFGKRIPPWRCQIQVTRCRGSLAVVLAEGQSVAQVMK